MSKIWAWIVRIIWECSLDTNRWKPFFTRALSYTKEPSISKASRDFPCSTNTACAYDQQNNGLRPPPKIKVPEKAPNWVRIMERCSEISFFKAYMLGQKSVKILRAFRNKIWGYSNGKWSFRQKGFTSLSQWFFDLLAIFSRSMLIVYILCLFRLKGHVKIRGTAEPFFWIKPCSMKCKHIKTNLWQFFGHFGSHRTYVLCLHLKKWVTKKRALWCPLSWHALSNETNTKCIRCVWNEKNLPRKKPLFDEYLRQV